MSTKYDGAPGLSELMDPEWAWEVLENVFPVVIFLQLMIYFEIIYCVEIFY